MTNYITSISPALEKIKALNPLHDFQTFQPEWLRKLFNVFN